MVSALEDVLGAIARAVAPDAPAPMTVGSIELRPQQAVAVRRARVALAEFGGALLADPPGLGKTFVALGVASLYGRCLVAAPASLGSMWHDAASRARVPAEFVSLEQLSRRATTHRAPLVIIDEAHRVATQAARRYGRVAALAHHAPLLLLTATPVRNRTAELVALLALFLGTEAAHADDAVVARCVIRRDESPGDGVPAIIESPPIRPRGTRAIVEALRSLPPPLAASDGTPAAALVASVLARCWASSAAALDAALVKRMQRGAALGSALADGRLPTRAQLRTWVVGDDAMQLAFPFVAAPVRADAIPTAVVALDRHVAAVCAIRSLTRAGLAHDTQWRARRLAEICSRHADAVVVAFTSHEATARAIFSACNDKTGVALLTGRGAFSGAGALARADVLDALAATGERERLLDVRLVIATDVLSEGVNLQRASVIVHLDYPWTPAAVTQRVGRAARLGSKHERVFVYRFAPPRSVEALVDVARIHRSKLSHAARALVPGTAAEALRQAVVRWARPERSRPAGVVAACAAARNGFLATLHDGVRAQVIGSARYLPTPTATDDPATVARLAASVREVERAPPTAGEIRTISRAIERWIRRQRARASAGDHRSPSTARRRVLGRIDHMLAHAAASEAGALAARTSRLRHMLASLRGAWVEHTLGALAGGRQPDQVWLDELERELRAIRRAPDERGGDSEIGVILLLRRSDAGDPVDQRSNLAGSPFLSDSSFD